MPLVGCPQISVSAFVKNWNSEDFDSACVHAFIDALNGDIYQTLPWNHRGWHRGGSSNNTHIGVEMCEPACISYTGGASFTCSDFETARACVKRTYDSAVELFAYLCLEYGLNPFTDICSHSEGSKKGIASNHADVEHLWDGFRQDVANAIGTVTPEQSNSERWHIFSPSVNTGLKYTYRSWLQRIRHHRLLSSRGLHYHRN